MSNETGGSVRGNDQVSTDHTRCRRVFRKRPFKGATMSVMFCEQRLEAVHNTGGGLIGYRCVACGAHYTDKGALIVEKAK